MKTSNEGMSFLLRLTFPMKSSVFCVQLIDFWSAKKKIHCELSGVRSVAVLPMHLGRHVRII